MTLPRLIGALVVSAAVAIAVLPSAFAADGSFQPHCYGSAKLGERSEGQTIYKFVCDKKIAGYTIVALNRGVDSFETEALVLTRAGEPVPGEDFGCSGKIPGSGIGCGGSASAWTRVTGSVDVSRDPCARPRPRLVVSVANEEGRVAGPYRLVSSKSGGPLAGCPRR